MNKFARLGIRIALIVLVIFAGYKLVESIMEPVKFDKVRADREEVIIDRLLQIRDLQLEYMKVHRSYATNFDDLKDLYSNGAMAIVYKEGSNDTLLEERAIELGLIKSDTTFVPYGDTLFPGVNFDISKINIVPYTGSEIEFKMVADTIERANFKVYVFEVKAYMKDYLSDIDDAELRDNEINILKKKDKFPGLKLGSLLEPSQTGNWE